MSEATTAFRFWLRLKGSAFGRWLFSKIVCFRAPYFSTVSPTIMTLEKDLCVGSIQQKRSIQNHIGSIHAIALCNLAELCGGLMTDVSIPRGMRWIPKGMTVNYIQKAYGTVLARAVPVQELRESDEAYEAIVKVSVTNVDAVEVFCADIRMWVSRKI